MSVKTMAKIMNIPITTIYSKIKRMEKLGIIKGYKAVVDYKKIGINVCAYICISTISGYSKSGKNVPTSEDMVCNELKKIDEVEEIHIVTGPWDIIAKVRVRNVESIGELILNRIRPIEGVTNTITLVSVNDIRS